MTKKLLNVYLAGPMTNCANGRDSLAEEAHGSTQIRECLDRIAQLSNR